MATLYTRNKYNAPSVPEGMTRQAAPIECFIHHTADDASALRIYNTKSEQVAKVRAIDQQHRNQGWSMGGYHWVVFQRTGERNEARGFQLRPAIYVPAAQQNHNTRTLAIVVVGDGARNPVFDDTLDCISQIIDNYKRIQVIGGHRDVVATSCPGSKFYNTIIPAIARRKKLKKYA